MAEIAGLKLIVPTSVAGSGVSVSASGKVTFTAATSVSVNGCFSATYDNYLVVCRHSHTGAADLLMRLRLSGTDNTTASSYTSQQLRADNTTVSGSRITQNVSVISATYSTQRDGLHLYVYGPALAQPTAYRSVTVAGSNSALINDHAVTHNQSTAYDGLTIYTSTSNALTGALTVYGLSQ